MTQPAADGHHSNARIASSPGQTDCSPALQESCNINECIACQAAERSWRALNVNFLDAFFLPFHMKNFWLQVLFEQGATGVAAHAALLLAGLLGAWRAAAAERRYFLAVAIALLAFHGVSLIDSVIDSPRFLQLYLSLALIGCLYGAREFRAGAARAAQPASAGAAR